MTQSTTDTIQARFAARSFTNQDVSTETLIQLLELANTAPSGFNLQPWEFLIVRDPEIKKQLHPIAMNQQQILQAPAIVIFIANPDAWKSYTTILQRGHDSGWLSENAVQYYRKTTKIVFNTGPLGLFGLAKKIGIPMARWFKPIPNVITSKAQTREYVNAHTMLAAATYMIAAKAHGLDTCPMQGFDESKLKKCLNIPASKSIPVIIPTGHAEPPQPSTRSIRLPVQTKTSLNRYGNSI